MIRQGHRSHPVAISFAAALGIIAPAVGSASCMVDGPTECRVPAGDAWCAKHRKPGLAYKDACLKGRKSAAPAKKPDTGDATPPVAADDKHSDKFTFPCDHPNLVGPAMGMFGTKWLSRTEHLMRHSVGLTAEPLFCQSMSSSRNPSTMACRGYHFGAEQQVDVFNNIGVIDDKGRPFIAIIANVVMENGYYWSVVLKTSPNYLYCPDGSWPPKDCDQQDETLCSRQKHDAPKPPAPKPPAPKSAEPTPVVPVDEKDLTWI